MCHEAGPQGVELIDVRALQLRLSYKVICEQLTIVPSQPSRLVQALVSHETQLLPKLSHLTRLLRQHKLKRLRLVKLLRDFF